MEQPNPLQQDMLKRATDAKPPLEELEDLTLLEDEANEVSLSDLYNQVYAANELIIIIDRVDEARVRKGLSSIKAKQNAKLASAGLPKDDATLDFISIEHEDKNKSKLKIILTGKKKVKIYATIVPDEEL